MFQFVQHLFGNTRPNNFVPRHASLRSRSSSGSQDGIVELKTSFIFDSNLTANVPCDIFQRERDLQLQIELLRSVLGVQEIKVGQAVTFDTTKSANPQEVVVKSASLDGQHASLLNIIITPTIVLREPFASLLPQALTLSIQIPSEYNRVVRKPTETLVRVREVAMPVGLISRLNLPKTLSAKDRENELVQRDSFTTGC